MKNRNLIVVLVMTFFLFTNTSLIGQTHTVSGNVLLNNQTNHENIEIYFERIAPSQLTYNVFTDIDGDFSKIIESGIYNITYSYNNYFYITLYDQTVYSDLLLPYDTLFEKQSLVIVPNMINSIQEAINQADNGDTIIVNPGIYNENISMNGKNIILGSQFVTTNDPSYISQTIIDGNNIGRVIEINNGENSNCIIKGLTIRNGYIDIFGDSGSGGGIYCYYTNPTLTNLIVENNTSSQRSGGGIYCENSNPHISWCIIRGNYASMEGGGIGLLNLSSPVIENTTIYNNYAYSGGGIGCYSNCQPHVYNSKIYNNTSNGGGGGISLKFDSHAILENLLIYDNTGNYCGGGISCYSSNAIINNSTIVNNHSNKGGGICVIVTSDPIITNCIVANNTGNYGLMNDIDNPGNPEVYNCNFYNNQTQNFSNCNSYIGWNVTSNQNSDTCDAYYNIQEDPGFIDISNYNLISSSPCIDVGNNSYVTLSSDLNGNNRIFGSTNTVDMGCFEFGSLPTAMSLTPPKTNLLIYPNPTSYKLTIENELDINEITIIDITGKIVKTMEINTKTINVADLPSGIYFIKLTLNEKTITKKFIKQ